MGGTFELVDKCQHCGAACDYRFACPNCGKNPGPRGGKK